MCLSAGKRLESNAWVCCVHCLFRVGGAFFFKILEFNALFGVDALLIGVFDLAHLGDGVGD